MTTSRQAAKRKGSQYETDVVRRVRELGLPAERLRLAGANDEGDVAVTDVGVVYIFECKAEQKMDLSGYVREAQVEAGNYAKARGLDPDTVYGVAVVKRRNRPIGESYVITTLDDFLA